MLLTFLWQVIPSSNKCPGAKVLEGSICHKRKCVYVYVYVCVWVGGGGGGGGVSGKERE